LITFSTGIIVPSGVLKRYTRAYNFHAASPRYPGRDPHHWAAYEGILYYGAVAHWMTERVDEGEIIGNLMFGVGPGASPTKYRNSAAKGICGLLVALAPAIFEIPLPAAGISWSGVKRRRSDLINMCDMRGVTDHERERRRHAFQGFEQFFRV
jgi:methionyl-tRNA formyltransferase